MNKIFKYAAMFALMLVFGATAMAQTEIRTAEELAAIRNSLEGSYSLMNDLTIDSWIPIGGIDGEERLGFNGTFDGNGHTITINGFDQQLNNTHVGLFGLIGEKGIVKNLRVAGKINYTGGQKFLYIGGISGFNSGKITCCASSVDLTCNYVKPQTEKKIKSQFGYEWGQFGGCITGINLGTIVHCYSDGFIQVFQGQAGGIAAGNGKPLKGGIGISIGSGGVGVAASSGPVQKIGGGIAYCYSTASVSSVVDNTGRGLSIICGGSGGIVVSNRVETATLNNCVAMNRLIEAKGDTKPKASPLPLGLAMAVTHPNFQFHYLEGVVTHRYDADNAELKPAKMSPKCAVALSQIQSESWWRMPEGLSQKEQRRVLGFSFGGDELAPWKWNDKLKRPVLYWEKDTEEE